MTHAERAILDEQLASEARVLSEAQAICGLCDLPVTDPNDAVVIKASELAPSQISHRTCEEALARLLQQIAIATRGGSNPTALGLTALRMPRE